jgi:Na+/H+ antiporter NhaD/arsenite permease-like protein
MVAFGISSIATADALSKTLYFGIARPILYAISLLVLVFGLWRYFRSQGICSLEEAKQHQRRVINTSILVLTIMILGYIIFNYFILELMGIAVGLPWEEDAFWN